MQVLIVDDEPLARSRLRTLLASCGSPAVAVAAEAAGASQAMELIANGDFDAVFLDVQMPGMDGVALARALRAAGRTPAIVFVTAHAQHAVAAFEVEAVDYLTKPVRLERLQSALEKVRKRRLAAGDADPEILLIQDRGRTERVPLPEVLYFKAELKYVTVRTAARSYILDASLSDLEERHSAYFLRIHRNALVARKAVRALEKHYDPEEGEGWAVRLNGIDELLAVSRRQLSAVRDAISA
ncbi:LytR/AlgR family response regulator transcription factor [Ramlibacter sp. PS4R-6]|uniref:LytR/AlgR family response regulator transcription factor n=1 Tax=Ramlibacter sp. PS4R-6 TaxID=3133438 RepID=UPI0030A7D053